MKNFGERLLKVQKQTGLSQAEFCEKLGIHEKTYKNYALEVTPISTPVLKQIANEFGIDIRWLLLGQGFINFQTLGDVVEAAVLETRTYFNENGTLINPEKEAKIVRYLVQQFEEHGSISEDAKQDFFNAII